MLSENLFNLKLATLSEDQKNVKDALRSKADIVTPLNALNQTALHLTFMPVPLTYLLNNLESNVDIQDNHGMSPLNAYIGNNNTRTDILGLFVKKGADPFLKDNYGNSAISRSLEFRNKEAVIFFIEQGFVKLEELTEKDLWIFEFNERSTSALYNSLTKELSDINHLFGSKTLLMHAIDINNELMFKFLVESGADPYIENNEGRSAITSLEESENKTSYMDSLLSKWKLDKEIDVDESDVMSL